MPNKYLYLFLTPIILLALNEAFVFEPQFFFVSLSLGLLVILFAVWKITKDSDSKYRLLYALSPALFYLSFSLYSGILVNHFWIQVIFIFNALFVFFYLRNLFKYLYTPSSEVEVKLYNLLQVGSFLSAFALAATCYGLPIFLSWNFGLLLLLFIAVSFILFGQSLIFSREIKREQIRFLFINVFILAEFAAVLFFLPLSYNVLGLLVALVFYLLSVFDNLRLENRFNFRNIKWPLIITIIMVMVILLSARWL
ncbi:hypothetical protein GX917_01165 [Candidatus Falkowbacteria bacterium]|jgi:hypothetical protein|nr:hypothetical protein [Candidatus Falkowbacteria bacterium]